MNTTQIFKTERVSEKQPSFLINPQVIGFHDDTKNELKSLKLTIKAQ